MTFGRGTLRSGPRCHPPSRSRPRHRSPPPCPTAARSVEARTSKSPRSRTGIGQASVCQAVARRPVWAESRTLDIKLHRRCSDAAGPRPQPPADAIARGSHLVQQRRLFNHCKGPSSTVDNGPLTWKKVSRHYVPQLSASSNRSRMLTLPSLLRSHRGSKPLSPRLVAQLWPMSSRSYTFT
jgi:hypothetical protein